MTAKGPSEEKGAKVKTGETKFFEPPKRPKREYDPSKHFLGGIRVSELNIDKSK